MIYIGKVVAVSLASKEAASPPLALNTAQVDEFSHTLRDTLWAVDLFNGLPDIYFYVKDRDSRWITCNDASMRLLGFKTRDKLYGLTEQDFFPTSIATAIRLDDKQVIFNGEKIVGRTEIIVDELGMLIWVSTTKLPVFNKDGQIAGLVGTTRVMRKYTELPQSYRKFSDTIEYIKDNISSNIDVDELAKRSNLSISQFRKRFKKLFGMAPNEFVLRTRLQMAARLLATAGMPLIEVALECGFCDQSYFTKRFHEFFGMTPRKYRQLAPNAEGNIYGGSSDATT